MGLASFDLSDIHIVVIACFIALCYAATVAIWRLYFSPIAQFPGPKLAALTYWYEFYFDCIQRSTYPWEINRMHKVYGPIVRINPDELHVKDPEWIDELLNNGSRPRDKSAWYAGSSGRKSIFGTVSHDLHRIRRSALNPFFSKRSIVAIEPLIQERVDKLCTSLSTYVNGKEPANLSIAYLSLTIDVISQYAFGKSYGLVDQRRFSPLWFEMVTHIMESHAQARHFPWLEGVVRVLPLRVVDVINHHMGYFLRLDKDMHDEVSQALKGPSNMTGAEKETSHRRTKRKTIIEEMRDSNLPPEQKSVDRLKEEGFILVLAGGDTSAKVLTALTYHLLSNPYILQRLKKELVEAIPDPNVSIPVAKLEQLPYLVSLMVRAKNDAEVSDYGNTDTRIKKAVITEGIRIASITTSRLSRSAPTENLRYKDWIIPPGTQVGITTHFIHLDPTLFPSPLTFNPSRWLHVSDSRPSYEKYFNPFSKGSRNCIGLNLAYSELYLTIATLFRRLEMRLHDTEWADVEIVSDLMIGYPRKGSRGVRVEVVGVAGEA